MVGEAWLFLLAVIVSALLLFTSVFFIIMFSDLECDYLNPIDLCNKLNQFVLPEMIFHALFTLLFLFCFQFIAFLINLPLLVFNVNKVRRNGNLSNARPAQERMLLQARVLLDMLLWATFPHMHIVPAAQICDAVYYLYRMILALVNDEQS